MSCILSVMSGTEPTDRNLEPRAGRFLVASPTLLDPNFMHAVVLICDHDDAGTYGLIINRRAGISLDGLDSDVPLLQERDDRAWLGGPVAAGQLQVLHRVSDAVHGAREVIPGVFLGGEPDALKRALDDAEDDALRKALDGALGGDTADIQRALESPGVAAPGDHVRFIFGYAGWGASQLTAELAEGAWVVCPATAEFVFDGKPDTLWRRVLAARGGAFAELVHLPPDPTWN